MSKAAHLKAQEAFLQNRIKDAQVDSFVASQQGKMHDNSQIAGLQHQLAQLQGQIHQITEEERRNAIDNQNNDAEDPGKPKKSAAERASFRKGGDDANAGNQPSQGTNDAGTSSSASAGPSNMNNLFPA